MQLGSRRNLERGCIIYEMASTLESSIPDQRPLVVHNSRFLVASGRKPTSRPNPPNLLERRSGSIGIAICTPVW
jgi:hypothetical protein